MTATTKTTKLTIKESNTLDPVWFEEQDNGSYKAQVYELFHGSPVWDRSLVKSEFSKTVYFTMDDWGHKTFYVRHRSSLVEIKPLPVKCTYNSRNVKWCIF